MSGASVHPFDRLPKLERGQRLVLAHIAAALDGPLLPLLGSLATPLLGSVVRVARGAPERVSEAELRARLRGPFAAVVLMRGTGGPAETAVVECSSEHAALLVDRVLGGDGESAFAQAASELDDLSCGVLAYLAARVIAAAGSELTLRNVTRRTDELLGALVGHALVIAPISVGIAGRRLLLRAILPEALALSLAPAAAAPSPSQDALAAVPMLLWAEGGRGVLPLSMAQSLGLGDVVVLDETGLLHQADAGGSTRPTFRGRVALCVGERTVLVARAETDTLIVEEPAASAPELTMTTAKLVTNQGPALAPDTPIELRVELASFSLTLAELSKLGAGDVLVTGSRLGEHVTLRANGRALAQGELVDVEGELGVRVLRLVSG